VGAGLGGVPVSGTFQVEEPVTLPEEGYAENLYAMGVPAGEGVVV
jgi:hypothetical protein